MKKRITCTNKRHCDGIQFNLSIDRSDERTYLIATCITCGTSMKFTQRKKSLGGI